MLGSKRTILRFAGVGLAVFAAWHYWTLYSNLSSARSHLLAVESTMTTGGLDATASEIEVARHHTRSAEKALAKADRHFSKDPLLRVGRFVPLVGGQIEATGELMEMGEILVAIGHQGLSAADTILSIRNDSSPERPLAESVIQVLNDTEAEVVQVEQLSNELVERRRELGDVRLLPPLASARNRLDARLPQLAASASNLAQAHGVLPGLLGFEGERRYLVLALNNGEALPGGGLVTAAGVMPVLDGRNGAIEFTDSVLWKAEWEGRGGGYIEPPGPLKRYLLHDFTWNLLVSNWSPDFPTWSKQALEFYEGVHGSQGVDGVIAVDLVVLERLLEVTGPQTLEVENFGTVTFTAEDVVLELERLTRPAFDTTGDRKSVIGDLARTILDDVQSLPSEQWGELVATMIPLGAERHIQMFSFHPAERDLLQAAGWDGRMRETSGDYLQFNEASANSTKLNLIIKPEAIYRIDLRPDGAFHELTLSYYSSLPEWASDKDPELVSALMLEGLYGGYLRVFTPIGATGFGARLNGSVMAIEDTGVDNGRLWTGVFLSLPAGERAEIGLRWLVPDSAGAPQSDYELSIQKQPGTDGLCTHLEVTRSGRAPKRLEVTGGTLDEAGRICLTTDITIQAGF